MESKLIPSRRPGRFTCVLGIFSIAVALLCVLLTRLDLFFPLTFFVGAGSVLIPLFYGVTEWRHAGDYDERNLIKLGVIIGCIASLLYFIGVAMFVPSGVLSG